LYESVCGTAICSTACSGCSLSRAVIGAVS
jgi:hypothetical protein